jgi:hypothetical protein
MPNLKFNDYPKLGVWPDGYYWSNNQFNLAGTAFLGVGVFALNRAKLLAGDPTANFIFFDLETAVPNARSMLPSDADGLIAPPAGAPNVFSYFNANEFVGETDSLRLYEFHADFSNPANSTFTQKAESPVAVDGPGAGQRLHGRRIRAREGPQHQSIGFERRLLAEGLFDGLVGHSRPPRTAGRSSS